ncbi:hypothetical protein FBQ99_21400 [Chloroflexi bacterium CFX2]|nr:hypothetical protein [Chloroflexi bacterium CFX2]
MSDKNIEPKGSFWTTVPGIIAALAALITAIGGCIAVVFGIPAISNAIFGVTPTPIISQTTFSPVVDIPTLTQVPTYTPLPTTVPPTAVPPTPLPPTIQVLIPWITDTTGVCRDDIGGYPRWSHYEWTLSQCEEACQNNPNCQGFAMSKERNYCQLMGSDGSNQASNPGTQITRGDKAQPQYSCYLKSADQTSISFWVMDSTGVCRDDAGGYPRWSAYDWTFSQCEQACQNNPNCQGFAMSRERNYCQLFGSDGSNEASNPGTQITHGDKSQPGFVCYIKR